MSDYVQFVRVLSIVLSVETAQYICIYTYAYLPKDRYKDKKIHKFIDSSLKR